jgi:hypothetical protein
MHRLSALAMISATLAAAAASAATLAACQYW